MPTPSTILIIGGPASIATGPTLHQVPFTFKGLGEAYARLPDVDAVVILTAHRDETLHLECDGEVRSYCIRKDRNDSTGQLATVYRFERINTDTTGA